MRHPVNTLTARWAAALGAGESYVMSGAAVWPLLAYLAQAADGQGRTELRTAVGVDADAVPAVLDALRKPAVRSAIGLWTARTLPLNPSWLATLPSGMRGELTGDPAADRSALDAWASSQTGGLVPAMPVTPSEDLRLVLAAALTVRTAWLQPFEDDIRVFRSGPWAGRELAVLWRSTTALDVLRIADTPSGPLTMLRVTGDGGVDVHLLLGEQDEPGEVLPAGIDALSGLLPWRESGPGVRTEIVPSSTPDDALNVTVPRFTVTSAHDLLRLPGVFGLGTVTDTRRGHFPGISPEPLAIGQAAQAAVAVFGATGFESSAVTAFGAVPGSAPPARPYRVRRVDVHFDRPFGFLAVERDSGLILTAGWVADPGPAEPVAR
ncbi:serpin family protein [Nonomuraea sp. SYSU D8015]|uniref:serpin family protein n=1 Tax=Nonomuraea sp. SYSU D8015 TaxID=2593644 RepID=UPI001660893B|nr:serpin family protein [Nonomuraea sp. SYSU D8015]